LSCKLFATVATAETSVLAPVENRSRFRDIGQSNELKMPLYEYELCDGDCIACGGKFTLRRPASAAELKACPACRRPVRKIISTFNSPIKAKPLSISDAKKAGFTILKKIGKGEYERQ